VESSAAVPARLKNAPLAALLSLIVPGAGQFYQKDREGGAMILLAALAQVYLINWALGNSGVAQMTIGAIQTSWLWFFLAAFWAWNVYDAYGHAQDKPRSNLLGILLPTLVVYIIAWQVTQVQLDRLVTRFGNALKIGNDIIHPDLFTHDASGAWVPSENFGYIFGTVASQPAPELLIRLGLVQAGTQIPTFQAGKIIETIALGLIATIFSTILAIPLSFLAARNITSRVRGGTVVYYVMRTFLNIVRAIDTLIWGLIVVLWVGLGSFAAVIALTIHSVAALGKLFSEEVEHIDPGPIEALTATGANLIQTIRYAVIPQIVPSFLGYTLLRWDINMRSATVVGMVAGGGIGFFVIESLRKSAYDQYAAALWAIAVVVMVVDFVSAKWRERIAVGTMQVTAQAPRPFYKSPRAWFYILVGGAAFIYFWQLCEIDLRQLLNPAPTFWQLVKGFVSLNLDPAVLDTVVNQMLVTIFQALLATTLGAILAIPFSFLAARNLTGRSRLSIWVYYLTRSLFNLLRSIEAILYVAIFFYWVGFGPFPGMLALAVASFGLIGKLFSEAIENIDAGPLEAITATGATRLQAIVFGILPQIIPPFVSYAIYQWDINVRMATIVGLAGGGGIGSLLYNDYFPFSKYRSAGTAVALIVLVVALMDFASAKIREKLV
jgi:phosphonate ABC transporter permease subunit PhnE